LHPAGDINDHIHIGVGAVVNSQVIGASASRLQVSRDQPTAALMRTRSVAFDSTTRMPGGSESLTAASTSSPPRWSKSADTDATRRARASGWSG